MPPHQNEFSQQVVDTLLKLHEENKVEWSGIRSLLLDFNERLVISEQTSKFAEQFRLHLLQEIEKVGDKIDGLRDLPAKLEAMTLRLEGIATTVQEHEKIFLQVRGGWAVTKIAWTIIAAVVAAVISIVMNKILKGL